MLSWAVALKHQPCLAALTGTRLARLRHTPLLLCFTPSMPRHFRRPLFSYSYKLLFPQLFSFDTLTKTPGVYGVSSQIGTRASLVICGAWPAFSLFSVSGAYRTRPQQLSVISVLSVLKSASPFLRFSPIEDSPVSFSGARFVTAFTGIFLASGEIPLRFLIIPSAPNFGCTSASRSGRLLDLA